MTQDNRHPSPPAMPGEETAALWRELAPRAPAPDWPLHWLLDRFPAEARR